MLMKGESRQPVGIVAIRTAHQKVFVDLDEGNLIDVSSR